jgi:hypothetical protein
MVLYYHRWFGGFCVVFLKGMIFRNVGKAEIKSFNPHFLALASLV